MFDFEEREPMSSILFAWLPRPPDCSGVGDRAVAHVPLPRITMSKSSTWREFSSCQRRPAVRKTVSRLRRGRRI